MESQGKETLFKVIRHILKRLVPRNFEKYLIIPILKKKKSEKCEDRRTISLVSHA